MRSVFLFQRSLETHKKFIQIALWIPSAATQPVDLCCCSLSHSLFFDHVCVSFSACCFFIEFVDPLTFSLTLSFSLSFYFFLYFFMFLCAWKKFLWCSFTHMAKFFDTIIWTLKKEWEKRSIVDLVFHSPIIIAM